MFTFPHIHLGSWGGVPLTCFQILQPSCCLWPLCSTERSWPRLTGREVREANLLQCPYERQLQTVYTQRMHEELVQPV